ncbi:CUB domain-containing protein [Caenorhabditis elegans]|nr:CUB domain-containing protein [Caenorhabditis elegans]CUR30049.1 CUB domain-containing protein [Caenorhabditis elegans]|eukprot:NP_001303750.1 Uncharacterized protein CELE_W02G9.4 [Caenorhabditis elegans]
MPTNLCSSILHNSEFDIITSPNFPYNYPDNISCAFLIKVSADRLISFQFVAFNTEDGYDVVSVYDGANTSAPLIGHYSGKNMPAPITSTSNTLYLCFSSDLVTNFSGFSGLYTSFVSNNFKRGVLPQSLTTDSVAIRRDKNILDWLKKKAEEKKLIGAAAAPVISI